MRQPVLTSNQERSADEQSPTAEQREGRGREKGREREERVGVLKTSYLVCLQLSLCGVCRHVWSENAIQISGAKCAPHILQALYDQAVPTGRDFLSLLLLMSLLLSLRQFLLHTGQALLQALDVLILREGEAGGVG